MTAPLSNSESLARSKAASTTESAQPAPKPDKLKSAMRPNDTISNGSEDGKLSPNLGKDTLSSAAPDSSSKVRFSDDSKGEQKAEGKRTSPNESQRQTSDGKQVPSLDRQDAKSRIVVESDDEEELVEITVTTSNPKSAEAPAATKNAEASKTSASPTKTPDAAKAASSPAKAAESKDAATAVKTKDAPKAEDTAKGTAAPAPAVDAAKASSTGSTDAAVQTQEAAKAEDDKKVEVKTKPYSIGTCLKNFFVKALWGGLVNIVSSVFYFFVNLIKAACCYCKKEKVEVEIDLKKEVETFKAYCNKPTMDKVLDGAISKLPVGVYDSMKEIVVKERVEAAKAQAKDPKEVDEKEITKQVEIVFKGVNEEDFVVIMQAADKFVASLEPKKEEANSAEKGKEKTKAA